MRERWAAKVGSVPTSQSASSFALRECFFTFGGPTGALQAQGAAHQSNNRANVIKIMNPVSPQASGTWTITGSLNAARFEHTATLLLNGMVLLQGEEMVPGTRSRAQNCTTQRPECGRAPAVSISAHRITRRRCCLTEWCLLQEELIVPTP